MSQQPWECIYEQSRIKPPPYQCTPHSLNVIQQSGKDGKPILSSKNTPHHHKIPFRTVFIHTIKYSTSFFYCHFRQMCCMNFNNLWIIYTQYSLLLWELSHPSFSQTSLSPTSSSLSLIQPSIQLSISGSLWILHCLHFKNIYVLESA